MTIGNTDWRAGPFTAGGGVGFNEFTFEFRVFSENDIRVVENNAGVETELALTADFSVALNADQNTDPGGVVTTVDTYNSDGRTITLISNVEQLQETELPTAGPYRAKTVEVMIDKLTALVHGLRGKLERAIIFPITDPLLFSVVLPSAEARANRSIGFDAAGNLLIGGNFVGAGVTVSAFMETVLDDADAGAALTTLGVSAFAKTLLDDANAGAALTTLGVSAFAQTLLDDAAAGNVLTTLGVSAFAQTLLDDAAATDALTTLGFSPFGKTLIALADGATLAATVLAEAGTIGGGLFATNTTAEAYTVLEFSAFVQTLLNDADAATFLGTLGISAFAQTLLDDANAAAARATLGIAVANPRGHIAGLTLSNDGTDPINDIGIAVGEATDDAQNSILQLTGPLVKQLDAAWAVGTGAGMRDTGVIADGTWHIFLIQRSDTGVVDVLASANASSPTMPPNYDRKRRIGSILRESGAIAPFTQYGDHFIRSTVAFDVSVTGVGTARITPTLSVPTGIVVRAHVRFHLQRGATDLNAVVCEIIETDAAPNETAIPGANITVNGIADEAAAQIEAWTNTSGQIAYRFDAADGAAVFNLWTKGWRDTRGRFA